MTPAPTATTKGVTMSTKRAYEIIEQTVEAVGNGGVVLDDLVDIARQYSAEIEYSDENVEALLDALFEE